MKAVFNTLLLFEISMALGLVFGWLLFGQSAAAPAPLTPQTEALMVWADDGGAGGG